MVAHLVHGLPLALERKVSRVDRNIDSLQEALRISRLARYGEGRVKADLETNPLRLPLEEHPDLPELPVVRGPVNQRQVPVTACKPVQHTLPEQLGNSVKPGSLVALVEISSERFPTLLPEAVNIDESLLDYRSARKCICQVRPSTNGSRLQYSDCLCVA